MRLPCTFALLCKNGSDVSNKNICFVTRTTEKYYSVFLWYCVYLEEDVFTIGANHRRYANRRRYVVDTIKGELLVEGNLRKRGSLLHDCTTHHSCYWPTCAFLHLASYPRATLCPWDG